MIAQLGIGTAQLKIWNVLTVASKIIVIEEIVHVPKLLQAPFTDMFWTTEGGLFILDAAGNVFTVNAENDVVKVIENAAGSGKGPMSMCWHKTGIIVIGQNQNKSEIRHYKKSGNWNCVCYIDSPEMIRSVLISKGDVLLAISENTNMFSLHIENESVTYLNQNLGKIIDFCFIHPTCDICVTLNNGTVLNVLDVSNGNILHFQSLSTTATSIVANPQFPYIGIAYENGIVDLMSVYKCPKLNKIVSFYLTKERISKLYFSQNGRVIVAAALEIGQFFIIEGLPGSQMEVVATIEAKRQILDFIIIPTRSCYRLYMIPVTSHKILAGNKIIRYCIIKNESYSVREYSFENEQYYKNIIATNKDNRDRVFYVVPYIGRVIYEVETKRGEFIAKIISTKKTGHQLRKINFSLDNYHALSWSYDGLIMARDADFEKHKALSMPHHRHQLGVKKALIRSSGEHILSLGVDNVLVCTHIPVNEDNSELKCQLTSLLDSPKYHFMMTSQTRGIIGGRKELPWIEINKINKIEMEKLTCLEQRKEILEELEQIKKELGKLVTKNLEGPENEKLNMLEFNLDTHMYEERLKCNNLECKATEKYLLKLIEAQNKICTMIKALCWNDITVKGVKINGFFENFNVENFVMMPSDENVQKQLQITEQVRELEQFLATGHNIFQPWIPTDEEKIIEQIQQKTCIIDKERNIDLLAVLEEDEEFVNQNNDIDLSFNGCDTRRFIELNKATYTQRQLNTYHQYEHQLIVSMNMVVQLKEYFNKEFEAVMNEKIKDMNNILAKNERLRYIISELNFFSEEKFYVNVIDPLWEPVEQPEQIVKVEDHEVPVLPYISPSEQLILNAQAAEAERIRLLLLADDFRERALMKMMNGVLEIRWEDELKKEVPLPTCMTEKQPEDFNEDDIRACKDYEEQCKILLRDRELYKNMLWTEYGKISQFLQDTVRKFNNRLKDLLILKMKVQSAIYHENLLINRARLNQQQHLQYFIREDEYKNMIQSNEKDIENISYISDDVLIGINECKYLVDVYQTKDKVLEKTFKKEFQDYPIQVQDQLNKLYKKRPKLHPKIANSKTVLTELANCVTSAGKTMDTLPSEGYDFLKFIDSMDQYVGVTNLVTESMFKQMCKHRRLKIEAELLVKAAIYDLNQAESAMALLRKRIQKKKEMNIKNYQNIEDNRSKTLRHVRNLEMQIVLPQGYVEVPTSGKLKDFDDALLICRKDIEIINQVIKKNGSFKIKQMEKAINFRKRISIQEWQHQRHKMVIEDLNSKLDDINNVRVIKEMRDFLSDRPAMISSVEGTAENMKSSYETQIKLLRQQIGKVRKQIRLTSESNQETDKLISDVNVDVCEFKLLKNYKLDEKEKTIMDAHMSTLIKRSNFVQQIQKNHNEILALKTELELLRLKTYPTLKYKVPFNEI